MNLVELVLRVHDCLDLAGLSHAFGGALALAYVIEPRGTVDVDVNVFCPVPAVDDALGALAAIEYQPERSRSDWLPAAGIRLRTASSRFAVDLFPSIDEERYAEVERRCVQRPFGPGERMLPFLSAEDLTVFKLSFGRDKDWVDLRHIAAARPELDMDYVEQQLVALRGQQMHPRLARMRRLLRPE